MNRMGTAREQVNSFSAQLRKIAALKSEQLK